MRFHSQNLFAAARARVVLFGALVLSCVCGQTATFQTVLPTSTPPNALVTGRDGNLYGTSRYGGTSDLGAVFRMTGAGSYQIIYNFTGGSDGACPNAGLTLGPDGLLYGACQYGGNQNAGAIFKITTAGSLTVLRTLTTASDGAEPLGALVLGTNRTLYGTASVGGSFGFGTVFQITTNGTFTVRHHFTSTDGSFPAGALTQGADGLLYGTTQYGGTNKFGTIFKMDAAGGFTSLISFRGTNGAYPCSALAQGPDLSFYGATPFGGSNDFGSFFKITSSGVFTPLYHPKLEKLGSNPFGGLTLAPDGIFYGAAGYGGTNGFGSLFQLTNGIFTSLYNFNGTSDGANPFSPLSLNGTFNLYGATALAGNSSGGTVYDLMLLHMNNLPAIANGKVTFAGSGGTPLGGFTIFTTTTPGIPRTMWQTVGTGSFDTNGAFSFTSNITLSEKLRLFYVRQP